jgi:hypothetical protein
MIIGISANDQQKIAEEAKESGMVLSYLTHSSHHVRRPTYSSSRVAWMVLDFYFFVTHTFCRYMPSLGMDGFMHKPFKLATLMDVIEALNERRKQVFPFFSHPFLLFFVVKD